MMLRKTRGGRGSRNILRNWYVWLILGLFWAVCILQVKEFRSLFTFRSILLLALPLLFVAFGEAVVIISGGFDLSVGVILSCATAIASETMKFHPLLGIASVLAFGSAAGAVNGLGVVKAKIDSFIMTLGTMFAFNGLALIIRPTPGGYIDPTFHKLIIYTVANVPLTTILLFIFMAFAGVAILQRKNFGREIYAIGGDREKARRAGINVDKVEFLAYVISGLSSAMGGLILAGQVNTGDAEIGLPYLFNAFIAVVLGGTLAGVGSFLQVIPAVLLMTSIRSLIRFLQMSTWYDFVVKGVLLVTVVAVQQKMARKGV
jgi:ribose transport system permease protein